jgi:hypothetical protein
VFLLTDGNTHFQTKDFGNTWSEFELPYPVYDSTLHFHAEGKEKIIALLEDCTPDKEFDNCRTHVRSMLYRAKILNI